MKTLPGKEKQWTAMPRIAGTKPEEIDKVAALKSTAFLLHLLWASWGTSFFFYFFLPDVSTERRSLSCKARFVHMNASSVLLKR